MKVTKVSKGNSTSSRVFLKFSSKSFNSVRSSINFQQENSYHDHIKYFKISSTFCNSKCNWKSKADSQQKFRN